MRRPVRCPWCWFAPMRSLCLCSVLGAAARLDSLRSCVFDNELAPCLHSCAGTSRLRGAGWRRPPCQNILRNCMRRSAALHDSAKPETPRILVVGSCVSALVSGLCCSGLGAWCKYPANGLHASGLHTPHSAVRSRSPPTSIARLHPPPLQAQAVMLEGGLACACLALPWRLFDAMILACSLSSDCDCFLDQHRPPLLDNEPGVFWGRDKCQDFPGKTGFPSGAA